MTSPLSFSELRDFLAEQCPTAAASEVNRTARALELMFRLAPAAKPVKAPSTARRYKDKPVAESLKLKR